MKIRSDSTEYAVATVTADHDLDGVFVAVALPAEGTDPTDWHPAQIESVLTDTRGHSILTYRLLLGPDGVTLPEGTYDWLVRVTDTPEVIVRSAGTVTVT